MAANYNNAYMEHCNCADSQVTASRKSIFTLETASMSYMLINNNSYNSVVAIDHFCLYLKQVQQLRTTPMPNYMEIANLSTLHDFHVKMATRGKLHNDTHGNTSMQFNCVNHLEVCTIAVPT